MLNGTMLGDSLDIMKWRISVTLNKLELIDSEYEENSDFKDLELYYFKRTLDVVAEYNKPYFDDMSKTSRRYMEFLIFKIESNIKLIGTMRNYNYIYKDELTKHSMMCMVAECKALKNLLEVFIDNTTEDNYIDNKKSKYEDIIEWCDKQHLMGKETRTKHILEKVKEFGLTAEIMKEIKIPYHSEFRKFGDDMNDLLEIQPVYKLIYKTNLSD